MKPTITNENQSGFALLEVLVAMTIMALVGLMAWRGMDVMIRGSETIQHRTNEDAVYFQLVQQFERDCQEILRTQEFGSVPIAYGAKNIWWLRHYRADGNNAWLLVGYGIGTAGLQRWTSQILTNRLEVDPLWNGISRDPDLVSTNLQSSLEIPKIIQQVFLVNAPPSNASTENNRGITIQWRIQSASFPITRSCLIGGGL
jgi:prepilin-type N-terminal cleavage/methylation domain-containing protein